MALQLGCKHKGASARLVVALKAAIILFVCSSAIPENRVTLTDDYTGYPQLANPLSIYPDWEREGSRDRFGKCVATAGDVNGDGFSDIIVGAYDHERSFPNPGTAYLFLGSAEGLSKDPHRELSSGRNADRFGHSVAPAGDVNGDGYDDVLVGAPDYNDGLSGEGRVFLYEGSRWGLGYDPVWSASGGQGGANLGFSVSTAGDVNRDGYSDVIIGAPLYDGGQVDEGRVLLYLGSSSGLSPSPAWTAEIDQVDANFGSSVASAGDVNGDGFSDVIIGAVRYENGEPGEGAAFVYLGCPAGLSDEPDWVVEGNGEGMQFGKAVATAGDVNGDGYGDVVVSAPEYEEGGVYPDGRVYVFLGSASGLESTAAWEAGYGTGYRFGFSVATAGDVNDDGFSDIIIGSNPPPATQRGVALVFLGSSSGLADTHAWLARGVRFETVYIQSFGASVCTAGDVNGDGYSDVIVGDPDYKSTHWGRAVVYLASPEGATLQAAWSWAAEEDQANAWFGNSVSSAGDVNGDGYPDVIVGAYLFDAEGTDEGMACVYLGTGSGLADERAWTATGGQSGDWFGFSVSSAGDINGDGWGDVIIGAPRHTNGQADEGGAYLYYGSRTGPLSEPAWIGESNQAGAQYGISVAGVGDVNGDGFSDVVVGAFRYDDGAIDAGRAFLYLGSPRGLSRFAAWTARGDREKAWFGFSVSSAGDVNGDGYSDVIVGAPSDGHAQGGRVFLYLGSSQGLSPLPSWMAEGDSDVEQFGKSVASAGDVNADGFGDVLVVADSEKAEMENEKRVLLYVGSPTGLSASPVWSMAVRRLCGRFKGSVATAGDVNGDGISDVIVGDYLCDSWHEEKGRVLVFTGSPEGLSAGQAWTAESDQLHAWFGFSVSAIGDVSGDGIGDILVGAPRSGDAGQGAVFAYCSDRRSAFAVAPRQARAAGGVPVDLLGLSGSERAFRLCANVSRPPAGGKMHLEWEVKPYRIPFDGTSIGSGGAIDTLAPSTGMSDACAVCARVTGLTPGTLYHWRVRIASNSPFFPHSRWFVHPYNLTSEANLRIGTFPMLPRDLPVDFELPGKEPDQYALFLKPGNPNPFARRTTINYSLPGPMHVRLAVYDVRGRRVRTLVDGSKGAGLQAEQWDGRDQRGIEVGSGVYFIRLDAGSETRMIKVMRIK